MAAFQDTATAIQKFDQTGQSLWMRYIPSSDGGPHNIAMNDTFILVAGNGYAGYNSYVTKTNLSGIVQWTYINQVGLNQLATGHSVCIDPGGDCYVSGGGKYTNIGGCSDSLGTNFIIGMSSPGSCKYKVQMPMGGPPYPTLALDKNHSLFIATPDSILKVNNGQKQWVVPILEKNNGSRPTVGQIKTDSVGNIYFLVGGDSIEIDGQGFKIRAGYGLLIKLSSSGSLVWAKEISGAGDKLFIGRSIYMTGYNNWIQKFSLNGDSVWCKKLYSDQSYFSITNIGGLKSQNLVAVTGQLYGNLMDGNDTILKPNGLSPFVAVLEDADSSLTGVSGYKRDDILIYPNPGSGVFYLKSPGAVSVVLQNMHGEEVKRMHIKSGNLDLTELEPGIYFLYAGNERSREMKKIVIVR